MEDARENSISCWPQRGVIVGIKLQVDGFRRMNNTKTHQLENPRASRVSLCTDLVFSAHQALLLAALQEYYQLRLKPFLQ